MCQACGNRRVVVVFEPPSNAARVGVGEAGESPNLRHACKLLLRPHAVREFTELVDPDSA
jgi:hypothetical protein